MVERVRVRFAPSPTGAPHLGNLRTALFNWLYARRHGGAFVLRVEDTDRDRYVEGAVEGILESLRWLGLDWDEGPEVGGPCGPYYQSQRLYLYHDAALRLVQGGYAYHCYCSTDRLEQMRKAQTSRGEATHYDRQCRDLPSQELRQYQDRGIVPTVRFKMPRSGSTTVHDLVRGEVTWQNELLDDLVLLKSDGYPTYHLANVVDDHHMEISHVLRAEEWLPSTPRHLQIYHALGYPPPQFAHLPMILGPDRAKLSKRHGATSVLEFRDQGFLPEAMINFMALLGWSLDDRTDVMSLAQMVESFSIEKVQKGAAVFDREKLLWMNGAYIRKLSDEDLAERLEPFLARDLASLAGAWDRSYLRRMVPLVRERIRTLAEGPDALSYFFLDEVDYQVSTLVQKGTDGAVTARALKRTAEVLDSVAEFEAPHLEAVLRSTARELGLSDRQFLGILRVATTGRTASPPLFETMAVLGRERCLRRVHRAIRLVPEA